MDSFFKDLLYSRQILKPLLDIMYILLMIITALVLSERPLLEAISNMG